MSKKQTINEIIFRAVAVILAYAFLFYLIMQSTDKLLFSVDFTEYWASSRLLLAGENPYSAELMWRVESQVAGWPHDQPVMMYNPPLVFGLILPFGLLSYTAGRIIWLILSVFMILLSSDICWQLYGGSKNKRWISWLLGIFFIPSLINLKVGQITPFALLGIVGFLYFIQNQKWYMAGTCILLLAFKPNFLYLFWPVLLLWILKQKRWQVLWAGLATCFFAILVPLIFNPQIFQQYPEAFSIISPYYWKTPTLSSGLRLLFGVELFWLQYVPPIFGFTWLVFYWFKHHRVWVWLDHLPLVLLVSAVTTFFGWNYDLIILIPAIMQLSIRITNTPKLRPVIIFSYIIINIIIGFIAIKELDSFTGVIVPPLLLLLYLFTTHNANREKATLYLSTSAVCK